VLNTLPLLHGHTAQLVDLRSRARVGAAWREANTRLLRLCETHPSVVVVDLEPLVSEGTVVAEPRQDAYAKAHLSPALLAGYARQAGHLARNMAGLTRKVLAVDLDGTLWGGTLGDDGPDGIELGGYRGEAFLSFQRTVKQLASQGVLLAAVSKNDPEPVAQVLAGHPDAVLRPADFVRVVANWRPKDENLAELADSLNLGTDSLVFADDSPFERGLVRRALPEVAVVDLDGEPAWHGTALLRDGWFDTRETTADDLARPARYRGEMARGDFKRGFGSLAEYLAEHTAAAGRRRRQAGWPAAAPGSCRPLGRQVRRQRAGRRDLPAPRRRRDPHRQLPAELPGLLRGIEQAALAEVLRHAAASGAATVRASYRPTAKNSIVADFYP
jgi:HAD superfamily phosphatase (TIGR01681 family)